MLSFLPLADAFLSTTIFSRFFFPFESLVLDEYDDSEPLPVDDPVPDELSRFTFLLFDVRVRSGLASGGVIGFLRFNVGIGDAAFFSRSRGRAESQTSRLATRVARKMIQLLPGE